MIGYEIKLKSFNRLDELSKVYIIPLKDAAVRLAQRIQTRVRKGVAPDGGRWQPLGTYTTSGRSKDQGKKWWVPPGQPQPSNYIIKVEGGEFAGWAVYENYGEYIEALPSRGWRTWTKTGSLWASMGVRAMAVNRVKVSFYGTKGRQYGYRTANSSSMRRAGQAQVANWAGRQERYSVLQYSQDEKREVLEYVWSQVNEEMAARIGRVAETGRINRTLRLRERRASRLLGG